MFIQVLRFTRNDHDDADDDHLHDHPLVVSSVTDQGEEDTKNSMKDEV